MGCTIGSGIVGFAVVGNAAGFPTTGCIGVLGIGATVGFGCTGVF